MSDNFIELGGNSLTAMLVISRLERHFHVRLALDRLLDAPTMASFVARVASLLAEVEMGEI
jgi:acyl carrier protein